ncbi:MAG: peptide-methionine (S)-S-oxide reductase MsrA [Firmicutes bacterium]|nr:peptide-methionine (S)-S-oxide reductase MsrA [Bacillota bacterium]
MAGVTEQTATLGGGCFWCLEAVFEQLEGVNRVVPGYAGGHVSHPTYRQVCTGTTGHAEVVQVHYDPRVISYRDLLDVFFAIHDPTTPNRQGNDVGPQYRSIILYHDEDQRQTALEAIREAEQSGAWGGPVVTQVVPLEAFYPAEEYHREYFRRNPDQGYCRLVIAPKVAKFRKTFAARLKREENG